MSKVVAFIKGLFLLPFKALFYVLLLILAIVLFFYLLRKGPKMIKSGFNMAQAKMDQKEQQMKNQQFKDSVTAMNQQSMQQVQNGFAQAPSVNVQQQLPQQSTAIDFGSNPNQQ